MCTCCKFFTQQLSIYCHKVRKSTQLLVMDIRTVSVAVRHEPLHIQARGLHPEIGVERLEGGEEGSTYTRENTE